MENKIRTESRSLLLEKAKNTSESPGVYLMKDVSGDVLYVGKAKNLRNRLVSYFQPIVHEVPKTEFLVQRVFLFDVVLTQTESEALILECTFIKKFKPKYNIRLKDDKAYPYLKINFKLDFPVLEWTRKVLSDGAQYFGPFPSAWGARQVQRFLIDEFKLRDCSENTFRHRSRPCLLFQMQRCLAPCVSYISQEEYHKRVDRIRGILQGEDSQFLLSLNHQMFEYAEEENYEKAAELRDRIKNLRAVIELQVVDEAGTNRNREVLSFAYHENRAQGVVLQIRAGRLTAVKHFELLADLEGVDIQSRVISEFLTQYFYSLKLHQQGSRLSEESVNEVLVSEIPEDYLMIEKNFGVTIKLSQNEFDAKLLQIAKTNAEYALEQTKKSEHSHGYSALEQLKEKLNLEKLPIRIECYDISNTQGDEAVASRVVFIEGKPEKSYYRRYRIKTVQGANDFAMMKEVLMRRFSNLSDPKADALPDLLVVDGGRGQLAQAEAMMEELGDLYSLQGIQIVGLAKARTESNFRKKEVKGTHERVFIPNRANPIPLYSTMPAFQILTHIRDEAHRFAITYHRKLRDKKSLGSQ